MNLVDKIKDIFTPEDEEMDEDIDAIDISSKNTEKEEITKKADILAVAIGKPKFITADMVKKDAVVVDIGINRVEGKVAGDVNFEEVEEVASYITPVPKGVGPMTIATLLENILECYHNQKRKSE